MTENLKGSDINNLKKLTDTFEISKDGIEIRDNLKEFVLLILKEENISPYELSKKTGCHETLWKNFLDGRTKMPDSGAIVALADYKKVSLDKVIGRDITKEIELKNSKETGINKKEIESKIPSFITGLPSEALQSIMQVREDAGKFAHKSPSPSTAPEQKKSFAEQVRKSNKPTERSR